MKKVWIVFLMVSMMVSSIVTVATADAVMGQKIFKKKLRKKCGFSGVKFAKMHTQLEWETLWDEDEFQKETKIICPRLDLKTIEAESWEHLYDFMYKNAKDGAIPKC